MGGCFQAIILSTMLNGFKLLIKFLKKTYISSVWYNRISLPAPKICTEGIYQTEDDTYPAWTITLARGPTEYCSDTIFREYDKDIELHCHKIIVINNYHG